MDITQIDIVQAGTSAAFSHQLAEDPQLVAWKQTAQRLERDLCDSAALVELLEEGLSHDRLAEASRAIARSMASDLECQVVGVGLLRPGRRECRLVALSHVARFDKRSETTRTAEAALDEAILNDRTTQWPADEDGARDRGLALQTLASLYESALALSLPLRDANGDAVGAWFFMSHHDNDDTPPMVARLEAAAPAVGTCLQTIQRLEGPAVFGLVRELGQFVRTRKAIWLAAAGALSAVAMAVPGNYHVRCECLLEPVIRRYVAAPFEGTVEQSFAKPGDLVSEGALLARLDGREVHWQRTGLESDHGQAMKRRDAALAARKFAEAEIAKLEIEGLASELRYLDHRAQNLEIKSPITGVVISGNLERAAGAPVEIGQTLFEVAPLDEMILEVAVPQRELAHVQTGQQVVVRLDTFPQKTWQVSLERLHPRSELRDNENVFVAEVTLDNKDELLRPGMDGRASISAGRHAYGWILFHKPWESLLMCLGW